MTTLREVLDDIRNGTATWQKIITPHGSFSRQQVESILEALEESYGSLPIMDSDPEPVIKDSMEDEQEFIERSMRVVSRLVPRYPTETQEK